MARPLKVFQTHVGFYDLVVAAPSMKAAAAAWNETPRIFAQGFASAVSDPHLVKAALAHPGKVLRRPHGSKSEFKRDPDSPEAPAAPAGHAKAAAKKEAARKRQEAAEKKRQAGQLARQKKADRELAAIEREEAKLRARRQAIAKAYKLRSV